jgi:broad specificity phosphatase PhoE
MDAVIFIIRHGEKPEGKGDPHLSAAGWDRAWKLASKPEGIGPPTHVFAAAASPEGNRPVETISPLASALGLTMAAED